MLGGMEGMEGEKVATVLDGDGVHDCRGGEEVYMTDHTMLERLWLKSTAVR
jgi:hypothetical protein